MGGCLWVQVQGVCEVRSFDLIFQVSLLPWNWSKWRETWKSKLKMILMWLYLFVVVNVDHEDCKGGYLACSGDWTVLCGSKEACCIEETQQASHGWSLLEQCELVDDWGRVDRMSMTYINNIINKRNIFKREKTWKKHSLLVSNPVLSRIPAAPILPSERPPPSCPRRRFARRTSAAAKNELSRRSGVWSLWKSKCCKKRTMKFIRARS